MNEEEGLVSYQMDELSHQMEYRTKTQKDIPYVYKIKLRAKKRGRIVIPPHKTPLDLQSCLFEWQLHPETASQPMMIDNGITLHSIADVLINLENCILHPISHKD
jgi:hypothetical protein